MNSGGRKNWKCTNMHSERDETVLNKELLRRKYIQIIQRENKKKEVVEAGDHDTGEIH
jgi:hypothetical protein